MNEQNILEELLAVLEANSVKIRSEPLGGNGGGLCVIKGEKFFFVDNQAAAAESAAICAQAVSGLVDTDSIYLKPQIREFIEKNKASG
ncbi:hypothetical protein ES703_56311 [subsurface metagenome]